MPAGKGNKKQGSIVDSFKKGSCRQSDEPAVQLEVSKSQHILLSTDVLESLNHEFKQFKSSLKKNLKMTQCKSAEGQLYDVQNECQEIGNRIVAFLKCLMAQGLYPDNGKVEILVEVLNQWEKHQCVSLALESFKVLMLMLKEQPCLSQIGRAHV
eukprot:TRINITY_DN17492_c2_g6_i1.p2 TRINITY_DN17492_c2_g6~~TRINITY_DN17492_c2_g6_i1.p2  ORF type:complete len:155 (+),score=6.07 TRINITY_DN17492_c2_g6_i1:114-578(+)